MYHNLISIKMCSMWQYFLECFSMMSSTKTDTYLWAVTRFSLIPSEIQNGSGLFAASAAGSFSLLFYMFLSHSSALRGRMCSIINVQPVLLFMSALFAWDSNSLHQSCVRSHWLVARVCIDVDLSDRRSHCSRQMVLSFTSHCLPSKGPAGSSATSLSSLPRSVGWIFSRCSSQCNFLQLL